MNIRILFALTAILSIILGACKDSNTANKKVVKQSQEDYTTYDKKLAVIIEAFKAKRGKVVYGQHYSVKEGQTTMQGDLTVNGKEMYLFIILKGDRHSADGYISIRCDDLQYGDNGLTGQVSFASAASDYYLKTNMAQTMFDEGRTKWEREYHDLLDTLYRAMK